MVELTYQEVEFVGGAIDWMSAWQACAAFGGAAATMGAVHVGAAFGFAAVVCFIIA